MSSSDDVLKCLKLIDQRMKSSPYGEQELVILYHGGSFEVFFHHGPTDAVYGQTLDEGLTLLANEIGASDGPE